VTPWSAALSRRFVSLFFLFDHTACPAALRKHEQEERQGKKAAEKRRTPKTVMTTTLFTIGHSNHGLSTLLDLLSEHAVTAVADVRSQPTSWLDHFDRAPLTEALRHVGIDYVFLGDELGARRAEPECYDGDRADYEAIARLPLFQRGLTRVRQGLEKHRVCLLCAEKEPLDCHRTILVCRHLRGPGIHIQHILADGTLEDHAAAELRLLKLTGVQPTLFEPVSSTEELIERAYEVRGREIAYRINHEEETRDD
jgi:hypothetical protein